MGWWPSISPVTLQLPPEMASAAKLFTAFYNDNDKTKHRRLQWVHSLGFGKSFVDYLHCYTQIIINGHIICSQRARSVWQGHLRLSGGHAASGGVAGIQ
jgi:hypothetical protein